MSSDRSNPSWLGKPLCRRYLASTFEVTSFKCGVAGALRKQQAGWAFGWLPDGECEGLGVWLRTAPEWAWGPAVVDDLRIRGVERLLYVTGTAPSDVPAAFSGGTSRMSMERLLAQALDASERHGLPAPAQVGKQIRGSLDRAIGRHGAFDGEAAAIDFIAAFLQRAERRLGQERLALMRHLPLAASVRPMLLALR